MAESPPGYSNYLPKNKKPTSLTQCKHMINVKNTNYIKNMINKVSGRGEIDFCTKKHNSNNNATKYLFIDYYMDTGSAIY